MGSTLTNLVYHVIFSTKGREQFVFPEIRNEFHQYMGGIIKGEGCTSSFQDLGYAGTYSGG
jgi:putative transposase